MAVCGGGLGAVPHDWKAMGGCARERRSIATAGHCVSSDLEAVRRLELELELEGARRALRLAWWEGHRR